MTESSENEINFDEAIIFFHFDSVMAPMKAL